MRRRPLLSLVFGDTLLRFSEQVEVAAQNDSGVQVAGLGNNISGGQMVDQDANCGLALEIRILVDGGGDCALLEVRDHFVEEVCSDQANFAGALSFLHGADYGHAVDSAYVDGLEFGPFVQKSSRFSVALFFGFVGFEDGDQFSAWTVGFESGAEPLGFSAVLFGAKHSRDYCGLRFCGEELCG